MKIIATDEADPSSLTGLERDWVYNGLDACLTGEIINVLLPQLDAHTAATYEFSRDLQGPALEMRLRGVLVDQQRRAEVVDEYYEKLDVLERNLERIVLDGCGLAHFNWRSNADKQRLFYEVLGIPTIRRRGRPTCDIAALEKMQLDYIVARQICAHLLLMGDIAKKISVLQTEVDPDGRMRTSYNIAGTDTGRFSSSFSEFGTGGNLQNVEEGLRSVFVADRGMKFAKFDAKQIQSRAVGALEWNVFHDGVYLDACESVDLHTLVAKMCWPEKAWTGDAVKDRAIAETKFYRWFSHRDLTKKLGHGSNFEGKPPTLSRQTGVPLSIVMQFQPKYYAAFPCHLRMHEYVRKTIAETGQIISVCGRKRQFWGRRSDDSTVRAAIAYDPQDFESYVVNHGMLNVWRQRTADVMMHDHDALTFQYPEEREDEVVPVIMKQLEVPVTLAHGRTLLTPYDCQVGWNRGKATKDNPDGLRDYVPGDGGRKRTPPVHLLDRR